MEKKARAVTESSVYLTVIAAVLVVVNVLSYSIHKQIDTTKNERFTLSKGSGRLVANLKKPVTVRTYVTTGLAKLDSFVRDLDDLMREYERASGGKFVYQKVVAKSEAEKQEAKEAQCREAAFGEGAEGGEDSTTITQGYMCLVFLYGDEKDNIPFLSPDTVAGLEFWITNKVREVRDKAEENHRRIGLITGHDEIKLGETNLLPSEGRGQAPSMRGVIENAFPYYKFEDVDLKGGETVIDEQIDALIVTQPGKDFTDKELRRIDEFLMKENKALVVYASATNIKPSDPKMTATLSTHNLDKLLTGYGVEMKKDAVLDWARSVRVPVPTQAGGMTVVRAPAIVQAQPSGDLDADHQMLDNSFIGFFRIEELSFPFPSSLVVDPQKQPGAEVKVVARTTPASWVETGDNLDLGIRADWRAKPPLDQRAIAASVTGKLKSAMGAGDGVETPAESKGQSRVLVVSSAQFLANPFARAGNGTQMENMGHMGMQMPPIGGDASLRMVSQPYAQKYLTNTIIALKNTLDWATGDSDMVAASAKMLGEPNLAYSDLSRPKLEATDDEASIKAKDEQYRTQRKRVQSTVEWVLILIAPIAFAGIGILRWQMRERRRNEIKV